MSKRLVYALSEHAETIEALGKDGMNSVLGTRGAHLVELASLDVPIIPGFTIASEACASYLSNDPKKLPSGLWDDVKAAVAKLEEETGRKFGGTIPEPKKEEEEKKEAPVEEEEKKEAPVEEEEKKEKKEEEEEKKEEPPKEEEEKKEAGNEEEEKKQNEEEEKKEEEKKEEPVPEKSEPRMPLILAVRYGAEVDLDLSSLSVFNIGLNDITVPELALMSENAKWAWDLYLKQIIEWSKVQNKVDQSKFDEIIKTVIEEKEVEQLEDLEAADLEKIVTDVKEMLEKEGKPYPQDVMKQLKNAVKSVYKAWGDSDTLEKRKEKGGAPEQGTAVTIMLQALTDMSNASGFGGYTSRNPDTGENVMTGTWYANTRAPADPEKNQGVAALEQVTASYESLKEMNLSLEKKHKSVIEVKYVVERGDLYILSVKPREVKGMGLLKLHVDFVNDEVITKEECIERTSIKDLMALMEPFFSAADLEANEEKLFGKGQSPAPGFRVGTVCLSGDKMQEAIEQEQDPILFIDAVKEKDIPLLSDAKGLVTKVGDANCKAALVAKSKGVTAVLGIKFKIDREEGTITLGEKVLQEGDVVSLHGETGSVYMAQIPLTSLNPEEHPELQQILAWADEIRTKESSLKLFVNADNDEDAKRGRELGAEGIGLWKTDQLFTGDRAELMQRILMTDEEEDRDEALQTLEEGLTGDFSGLFEAMTEYPVTITLGDPPIEEFIPNLLEVLDEVTTMQEKRQLEEAEKKEKQKEEEEEAADPEEPHEEEEEDEEVLEMRQKLKTLEKVRAYHERNPVIGLRGMRFSLCVPGILKAQLRAICEAACAAADREAPAMIQVVIPFVCCEGEVSKVVTELQTTLTTILKEHENPAEIKLGTMIEVPRAALVAEDIAKHSECLTFDTNVLTEMSFGMSKEEAEKAFLGQYKNLGIFEQTPFDSIDEEGVGQLISMAIDGARKAKPDIEIGIAGDAGDLKSMLFFHKLGVSHVSLPIPKIPLARLAMAQAVLLKKKE